MLPRLRLLLAIVIGLTVLAACGTQVEEGVEFEVTVVGQGTVTSNPLGINTRTNQTVEFNAGAIVTLTAVPDEGHRFVAWSEDCDGNTCVLTMIAPRSVTATFEAIPAP